MKGKILWRISKTPKPSDWCKGKFWLHRDGHLWIDEFVKRPLAKFDDRGEARKALNERLSFEIKNWGLEYAKRWTYKVEEIIF